MTHVGVLAITLKWIPWTDTIPVAIICGALAYSALQRQNDVAGGGGGDWPKPWIFLRR